MEDFSKEKIKLVIWDLDDTFWQGTLSEGPIKLVQENLQLVKELAKRGIISSICSNNDLAPVKEVLEKHNLWQYFIFPKVSWARKGTAIASILDQAQLRSENTLFIDDKTLNLEEAKFVNNHIRVLHADDLPRLRKQVLATEISDKELNRLAQYHILEKKSQAKSFVANEDDFLVQSEIKVGIVQCSQHIERLLELIQRTNQLNFTKNRMEQAELETLLADPAVTCRAIHVVDKYGDYGICGFYALRQTEQKVVLEHFLFSCRVLNMGIEQWTYFMLGHPELSNGEVLHRLGDDAPEWIGTLEFKPSGLREKLFSFGNRLWHSTPALRPILNFLARSANGSEENKVESDGNKILLKGGCTVEMLNAYLQHTSSADITVEVGEWLPSVATMEYLYKSKCVDSNILEVFDWSDDDTQQLAILKPYNVYVLDLAKDFRAAYYRFKDTDLLIPVAPFNIDLTKDHNWPLVSDWKEMPGSGPWWDKIYSAKGLEWLKQNCTMISQAEKLEIFEKKLTSLCNDLQIAQPEAKILLVDHSITAPDDCFFMWRELPNEINKCKTIVQKVSASNNNIDIIDMGEHVTSGKDYFDGNPFHYKRKVRFEAAQSLFKKIIPAMT